MSIATTVKAAQGWGKVAADCSAISGLISAQVRKINYRYLPTDQPKAIDPGRIITLVQSVTDSMTDFYGFGAPAGKWTILVTDTVSGAPRTALYEMVVSEVSMEKTDDTTTKYTTVLTMQASTLQTVLARKDFW